jgi:pilus assembly protein CpaC
MVSVAAWDAPRPQCPLRVRALLAILIIFLPGLTSILYAQTGSAPLQASVRPAAGIGAAPDASAVTLLVGRSTVLDVPGPISRLSLTSPEVADALVTTPSQVLIHGKTVGTISMFVWDRGGGIRRYEVVVHRDMSQLESQLHELFPGEPISVAGNGKNVVISGTVSSKYVMDKAAEVAVGYVEKKENVVNLLQQAQAASNQVLLRVRFAEVARTALTELGASFFTSPTGVKNTLARTTTEQYPAPGYEKLEWTKQGFDFGSPVTSAKGEFTFSDFLNLFLFSEKYDIGTMLRLLQTRGLFQALAEPNLIAQNGQEASFLAGGEYPYPVVQGSAGGLAVTIQFKEFGIRLSFTPTVLGGDLIHLKVRPEVSSLDFTNAVSLQGFRVPALSTRRAETQLELRDGQTFAIAGLLNNSMTSTLQKIPGIGDIPVLGLLFKSKAARKEQTELVVMITPQIVRPGAPGAAPAMPGLVEPFLPPAPKTIPLPPPYGGPAAPRGSLTPAPADNARTNTPPAETPATATSAAPAPAAAANAVAPPPPPKPTRQEREALERAKREEQKRQQAEAALRDAEQKRAAEQAKLDAQRAAEEQRHAAAQAQIDAERAAEEQKRAAAQAKIDAQRAAEAARKQQEVDREQGKQKAEADRRAAEARKRQEEAERKRGQALAEAEARLKAAQTAYQEQLKRSSTQNQQ